MKREKKDKECKVRMSDEDMEMLNYICKQTGKTASEIIRNGVRMQYNLEKAKE